MSKTDYVEDFSSLDDFITSEMYFEGQLIKHYGDKEFASLLRDIVFDLENGKTIRQVKKRIKKTPIVPDLEDAVAEMLSQQTAIITGKKRAFDMAQETLYGSTFKEAVEDTHRSNRKRAIRFAVDYRNKLADKTKGDALSASEMVDNEVRRYKNATEAMWRGNAKVAREYAYQEAEEEVMKSENREIRGWMSIAVLDNRTSAKCAGLHNTFYPIEEYGSRDNLPNLPPRHPHCRSIIITVWRGEDLRNFKAQNLNTFLKRNPKIAEEMMGKEKYRLWMGGKAKIDKYIDIKGGRWWTNEEIIKRLGIKSEKRLQK